jgi:hypothetical protein
MNEHLSDEQIQTFVFDRSACEQGIGEHVQQCDLCQTKVEAYQLMITAIEEQPIPAFDFDISEAVLANIELQKRNGRNWWLFMLIAAGVLITGVAVYLFIEDITILFKGIGTFLTYLIILTGVFILVAVVIDMLKTYKTKMHMLDISK